MEKMILTAQETAILLNIGMNKMYELLVSGDIPSRRIGRKYLIPRLALEKWLNGEDPKEDKHIERLYNQSRQ